MLVLFFDTETTGVKSWQEPNFVPRLVQLGAIMQDTKTGRVVAELNLINEEVGVIPVGASNVHGITTEMAKVYGVPKTLIDETFARLIRQADVLVAHNIDYDLDVVKDNMPESQYNVGSLQTFCTMAGSQYLVKAPLSEKQKNYFTSKGFKPDAPFKVPSLMEAYKYFFNEEFVGAHDAMADIRACSDIYHELIKQGWFKSTEEFGAPQPTGSLTAIVEAENKKAGIK